jgi:hypothetical protein
MPRNRGLYFAMMALRVLAVWIAVVLWYFFAPLDRPWNAWTALTLGAGLFLIGVGGYRQARAVVRSPFPRARVIAALMLSFPLLVVLFAGSYVLLEQDQPGAFSQRLTRLAALYLTLTVLSTVGFGDITPVSDAARVLVMVQMLADLVYLGLFVQVLAGAARTGVERRTAEAGGPSAADGG